MRRTAAIVTSALVLSLLTAPPVAAAPQIPAQPTTAATAAEPSLPTASLSGSIVDALTGAPIPGACLEIRTFLSNSVLSGRPCADDLGHYQVSWRSNSNAGLSVTANAPGYYSAFALGQATSMVTVARGSSLTKDFALAPTGASRLVGQIFRPDGTPQAFPVVGAYLPNGVRISYVYGNADGTYSLPNLPATTVQLRVTASGFASQYWPGKTTAAEAGSITLAAGETKTVNETLLPVSTLPPQPVAYGVSGTVTDRATGQPIAGATVQFATSLAAYGQTQTGADGHYALTGLSPTSAGIRVTADGYADTWSPDDPTLVESVYGAAVVRNVALRKGQGGLALHILDYDGLAGDGRASVTLTSTDKTWTYSRATELTGDVTIPNLPVGSYQVTITFPGRYAWTPSAGITITDGNTTELTLTHPKPGQIIVHVVNDTTGAPIAGACVLADIPMRRMACADETGKAVLGPIWSNGMTATVSYDQSGAYFAATSAVTARADTDVSTVLRLRPGTVLGAQVAVPDGMAMPTALCVAIVRPLSQAGRYADMPLQVCSSVAADGGFKIGPVEPGVMRLLIIPDTKALGLQWLGAQGGTGRQEDAAVIDGKPAQVVMVPRIRLDRAGSIAGAARNKATGAPTMVCVRPFAWYVAGFSGCDQGAASTYRVDGLGPYAWPLRFRPSDGTTPTTFARGLTWSGGTAYRLTASGVTVTAGVTTTYDQSLEVEARVAAGTLPATVSFLEVFDAWTGDFVDSLSSIEGGRHLSSGPVFYRAVRTDGSTCWLRPGRTTGSLMASSTLVRGVIVPSPRYDTTLCTTTAPTILSERMQTLPRRALVG